MLETRAYGRVIVSDAARGLKMVSARGGYQFLLYSLPFLSICSQKSRYTRVKRANRQPEKAIGYHGGEIFGSLQEQDDDAFLLRLYFGSLSGAMLYNHEDDKLDNVSYTQDFEFPKHELHLFRDIIQLMEVQHQDFNAAILDAEIQGYCLN